MGQKYFLSIDPKDLSEQVVVGSVIKLVTQSGAVSKWGVVNTKGNANSGNHIIEITK